MNFSENKDEINKEKKMVKEESFYNETVNSKLKLETVYKEWIERGNERVFSWLNFPFLFNPLSKSKLVYIDSSFQMQKTLFNQPNLQHPSNPLQNLFSLPFLVLQVSRNDIITTTFQQLSSLPKSQLKKPLKVSFLFFF